MPVYEPSLNWRIETPSIRAVRTLHMAIVRYDMDDAPSHGEPLYPPSDPRHAERTKYALYFRGEFIEDFRRLKYAQDAAEKMVESRVNMPQWMSWRRDA